MISYILGRVIHKEGNKVVLDVGGIGYEILVPSIVMKGLTVHDNHKTRLFTFHYLESLGGRVQPVLVGFNNVLERDFFKEFIKVSGIGPKTACQALSLPFSMIAKAIDQEDIDLLTSLPGIGAKTARKIIAELQGKVGRFHLIQNGYLKDLPTPKKEIEEEGIKILLQLQYTRAEAKEMVKRAFEESPQIDSIEELMNQIYRVKNKDGEGEGY